MKKEKQNDVQKTLMKALFFMMVLIGTAFPAFSQVTEVVVFPDPNPGSIVVGGNPVTFTGKIIAGSPVNGTLEVIAPRKGWVIKSFKIYSDQACTIMTGTGTRQSDTIFLANVSVSNTFQYIKMEAYALCDALMGDVFSYRFTKTSSQPLPLFHGYAIESLVAPVLIPSIPMSPIVVLGKTNTRTFSVKQTMDSAYVQNLLMKTICRDINKLQITKVEVAKSSGGPFYELSEPIETPNDTTYHYSLKKVDFNKLALDNGIFNEGDELFIRETYTLTECGYGITRYSGAYYGDDPDQACAAFVPVEMEIYANNTAISPDFLLVEQINPTGTTSTTRGKFVFRVNNYSTDPSSILRNLHLQLSFEESNEQFNLYKAYLSDNSGDKVAGTPDLTPDIQTKNTRVDLLNLVGNTLEEKTLYGNMGLMADEGGNIYSNMVADDTKDLYITVEWNYSLVDKDGNALSCDDYTLYNECSFVGLLGVTNHCNEEIYFLRSREDNKSTLFQMGTYSVYPPKVTVNPLVVMSGTPVTISFQETGQSGFAAKKNNPANVHKVSLTIPADMDFMVGTHKVYINGQDKSANVQVSGRTLIITNDVRFDSAVYVVQAQANGSIISATEKYLHLEHIYELGGTSANFACSNIGLNYMRTGSGGGSAVFTCGPLTVARTTWGFDDTDHAVRITDTTGLNLRYDKVGPYDNVAFTYQCRIRDLKEPKQNPAVTLDALQDTLAFRMFYQCLDTTKNPLKLQGVQLIYKHKDAADYTVKNIALGNVNKVYHTTYDISAYVTGVPGLMEYNVNIAKEFPDAITELNDEDTLRMVFLMQTTEKLPVPEEELFYIAAACKPIIHSPQTQDVTKVSPPSFGRLFMINYNLKKMRLINKNNSNDMNKNFKTELFRYVLDWSHEQPGEHFPNEYRPNAEISNLKMTFQNSIVDVKKLYMKTGDSKDSTLVFDPADYTVSYSAGKTTIELKKKVTTEVWNKSDGFIFWVEGRPICWNDSKVYIHFTATQFFTSENPIAKNISDTVDLEMSGNKYEYNVFSAKSNIRPRGKDLAWDITVENRSVWAYEDKKLPNSWMAFELPVGVTPKTFTYTDEQGNTTDLTSGLQLYATTNGTKYWVKLGELDNSAMTTDLYRFHLTCTYALCNATNYSLTVKYGCNPVDYPTNPDMGFSQYAAECYTNCTVGCTSCPNVASTELKFMPYDVKYSTRLAVQTAPVRTDAGTGAAYFTFCQPLDFVITASNNNMNELYDISLKIPTSNIWNKAIEWKNGLTDFEYAVDGTNFQAMPADASVTVASSFLQVDMGSNFVLMPYGEPDSKLWIRFTGTPECGYTDGMQVVAEMLGKSGCGMPYPASTMSSPVFIDGLSELPAEMNVTTSDIKMIYTTATAPSGQLKGLVSYKSGTPTKDNIVKVILPENVKFVGSASTGDSCVFKETVAGSGVLMAVIPANTVSPKPYRITVQLQNPAQWACTTADVVYQTGIVDSLECEGVKCPIERQSSLKKISKIIVSKRNLIFFNAPTITGERFDDTYEAINITSGQVRNNSEVAIAAGVAKVELFLDNNGNGILDAADSVLRNPSNNVPYTMLLPAMSNPPVNVNYTLNGIKIKGSDVCKLMLVINKNNDPYLCETQVYKPYVSYKLKTSTMDVCQGVSVPVGDTALTDYQYTWSFSESMASLSSTGIARPTFIYDINDSLGSNKKSVTFDLKIIRPGGCEASMQFTVLVNPAHKLRLMDGYDSVMSVCVGTPVEIKYESMNGATGIPALALEPDANGISSTLTKNGPIYTLHGSPLTVNDIHYKLTSSGITCASVVETGTIHVMGKPIISNLDNKTVCNGNALNLTAGVVTANGSLISGYVWKYSKPDTSIIGTTVNLHYVPTQNGKLFLEVSNTCGTTVTAPADIEVFDAAYNVVSSATPNVCAGGSAVLTASAFPGVTYQWQKEDPVNGWEDITGATDSSYTTPALNVAGGHHYRRVVNIPSCGNQNSDPYTITVHTIIGANTITGGTVICSGSSTILNGSDLSANANGTYLWQASTNGTTWVNAAGTNNEKDYTTGNLTTTTYFRRNFATLNCQLNSNIDTVRVYDNATLNTIAKNDTLCFNSSTTVNGSNITATFTGATYQWQKAEWNNGTGSYDAFADITTGGTSQNYPTEALTVNTKFRRTVSVGSCATQAGNEIEIVLYNNAVENTIAITGEDTLCNIAGNGTSITGSAIVKATYVWKSSSNGTTWTVIAGKTAQDLTLNGITASTYYKREVSKGQCKNKASDSVLVVVNQPVSITSNGSITVDVCESNSSVSVPATKFSVSGGTHSIHWNILSGGGSIINGGNTLTPEYEIHSSDVGNSVQLQLVVVPLAPCDTQKAIYVINVKQAPDAQITNLTPAICKGQSYHFSDAAVTGTTNYKWEVVGSYPAVDKGTFVNPATLTPDFIPTVYENTLSSVDLRLVALSANASCVNDTAKVVLTLNNKPTMDPVSDQEYCHGDAVVGGIFFSGSALNYNWQSDHSFGAGTSSTNVQKINGFTATNNTAGVLTANVSVVPLAGCPGDTTRFTVKVAPDLSLTSSTVKYMCSGLPVNYTATTADSTAVYTWSRAALPAGITGSVSDDAQTDISGATITETLTNNTTDSISIIYTYTVKDTNLTNDCSKITNVRINVAPAINISNIATVPTSICSGGSVQFTPTPIPALADNSHITIGWGRDVNAAVVKQAASGIDVIKDTITSLLPMQSTKVHYTYTLTYDDGHNRCVHTDTFNVVVTPSYTLSLTTGLKQHLCFGNNINDILVNTTAPLAEITVNGLPAGVSLQEVSGTKIISGTPTASGRFDYTVSINGCSGPIIAYDTIWVNASPEITIASSPVCMGTDATVTFKNAGGPVVNDLLVAYKIGSGSTQYATIDASKDSVNITVANVTTSTIVQVSKVTDQATTCYRNYAAGVLQTTITTFTQPAKPSINMNPANGYICLNSGDSVILSAPKAGYINPVYTWYRENVAVQTVADSFYVAKDNVLGTAKYKVSVADGGCNSAESDLVQIEVKGLPNISFNLTNLCLGDSLQVVASASPGTFHWHCIDNKVTLSETNVNNPCIKGVVAGTCNVNCTLTDANGCENTHTESITIHDLPIAPVVTGNVAGGVGVDMDLSAVVTPVVGCTYKYYTHANRSGQIANPSSVPYVMGQNTYYVSAINSNACEGPLEAISIDATVEAMLSGSNTICAGKTATLSVAFTGGIAPYDITYSDGTNDIPVTGITSNVYNFSVTPVNTTTYTMVSVSDQSGAGLAQGSATITVNPAPQVSVSPLGAFVTVGNQVDLTITDNNTNPAASAMTAIIKDPAVADISLTAGVITVSGKKKGNTEIVYTSVTTAGCETQYSMPVQVEGLPTAILTGKDIIVCNDSTDSVVVQIAYMLGGVAPWKVTVSNDKGFSKDTTIASIEAFPVNMIVPIPFNTTDVPEFTTYVVSNVEDSLKSTKQTHYGFVRIGVNPTPRVDIVANKVQTVCAGQATLPISFNGISTIFRTHIDKNIGALNYTKDGIPSFIAVNTGNQPDTATIVVIPEYWYNNVVCLGEPDTAVVVVVPALKADFSMNLDSIGRIAFTNASSASATQYEWNFGDANTSSAKDTVHTYLQSGVYTVTLTVRNDEGCSSTISKQISISVITDLTAKFSVNQDVQCLNGNSYAFHDLSTISTPNHSMSTWKWYFGNGDSTDVQNPVYSYDSVGTYEVRLVVTEQPGNTQSSYYQTVKVLAKPAITLIAPDAVCEGGLLSLAQPIIDWKGNMPVAGTWMLNGHIFTPNTQMLSIADSGKLLTYHIGSACGDTTGDSVEIVVNRKPMIAQYQDKVSCPNEKISTITFGAMPFTWKRLGADIGLTVNTGKDSIPSFTTINPTAQSITARFEIIPNNGTCEGPSMYFDITVSPGGKLTGNKVLDSICSGSMLEYTATSNNTGVHYTWERPVVNGINNGSAKTGQGALILEKLTNTADTVVTVPYYITLHYNECVIKTDTVHTFVKPTSTIRLLTKDTKVCFGETEVKIPYTANQPNVSASYKITFDKDALLAGFENMDTYETLPADHIRIALPAHAKAQRYIGMVSFETHGCGISQDFPFTIYLMPATVITEQPEKEIVTCDEDPFSLSVKAEGDSLTYQWFLNGQAIHGATNPVYTKDHVTEADFGTYHVEIKGACGQLISQNAVLRANEVHIGDKWGDLLFVYAADSTGTKYGFSSYQWYKENIYGEMKPILDSADAQYYQDPRGLNGTYAVKVTYADGSTRMSCPVTFTAPASAAQRTLQVYPNPVEKNHSANVRILNGSDVTSGKLEMFDMQGKKCLSTEINGSEIPIRMNVAKGVYTIHVIDEEGNQYVEKIIVR